jgi:hypothetical protein
VAKFEWLSEILVKTTHPPAPPRGRARLSGSGTLVPHEFRFSETLRTEVEKLSWWWISCGFRGQICMNDCVPSAWSLWLPSWDAQPQWLRIANWLGTRIHTPPKNLTLATWIGLANYWKNFLRMLVMAKFHNDTILVLSSSGYFLGVGPVRNRRSLTNVEPIFNCRPYEPKKRKLRRKSLSEWIGLDRSKGEMLGKHKLMYKFSRCRKMK